MRVCEREGHNNKQEMIKMTRNKGYFERKEGGNEF